jgi:hypothetical protein
MKPARVSVVLTILQVIIVASVGAQYVYQRWTCPRVWVRAVAPEARSAVSGHYLNLQLVVDGCQSTLPSAKAATFPRDINGAAVQGHFGLVAGTIFRANLKVQNNRLIAINAGVDETGGEGQRVVGVPGTTCDQMRTFQPVPFYTAANSIDPSRLNPTQELWVEITVPSAGPPRPLQLALKDSGSWKPIAIQ